MIALIVLIVCVLKRYRRRHRKPPSVAAIPISSVPNNISTITTTKKDKELNEDAINNPLYDHTKENEYSTCTLSENDPNLLPADYEVPYDNVMY